jgi:hypothetical protein
MKTFFLEFEVAPTNTNAHFDFVEGALAACWIKENNSRSASAKARFFILKGDWEINKIETSPIEVTGENFLTQDWKEHYIEAQKQGVAIAYVAWARDGTTTAGPLELKSSYKPPISNHFETIKKLTNKGRCLHYDNGHRCDKIIKAHSIQKNRSLSEIADNGHVYIISSGKNNWKLTYEKRGINKVSTFLGFCKLHDNELFEPIDNYPLIPTDQQIILYSYRSICRELFVKENSVALFESQINNSFDKKIIIETISGCKTGATLGLDNLKRHKGIYDKCLINHSYSDIRYTLFISKQKPTIAFSGLFYPDFDFMGRPLQNLGDQNSSLQLITICSAPMPHGWGFLLAWHVTSSHVCIQLMRSLATMIHNNEDSLGDYLFRLVMSNCENLAISPQWWEALPAEKKEQIEDRATLMADIFSTTEPCYLTKDLDGISNWRFENIIYSMH